MTLRRSVHILVSGRVQGVGYRAWLAATARSHSLSGWVRNRHDGTVEAVLHGTTAAVDAMLSECHDGPPAAEVLDVLVTSCEQPESIGFEVRPSS